MPDVDIYCADVLTIHRTDSGKPGLLEAGSRAGPGVGVVMATDHEHANIMQHFGVCLDGRNVLHSQQNTGAVLDRLDVLRGALCVKGFYAWSGPTR